MGMPYNKHNTEPEIRTGAKNYILRDTENTIKVCMNIWVVNCSIHWDSAETSRNLPSLIWSNTGIPMLFGRCMCRVGGGVPTYLVGVPLLPSMWYPCIILFIILHNIHTINISSIYVTRAIIIKRMDGHCMKYNWDFSLKKTLEDG